MTSYSRRFYNKWGKGPGGFSHRDWYSSRVFDRLPPGPLAPRQTPQNGEAVIGPAAAYTFPWSER
jgi:hypothetical protein